MRTTTSAVSSLFTTHSKSDGCTRTMFYFCFFKKKTNPHEHDAPKIPHTGKRAMFQLLYITVRGERPAARRTARARAGPPGAARLPMACSRERVSPSSGRQLQEPGPGSTRGRVCVRRARRGGTRCSAQTAQTAVIGRLSRGSWYSEQRRCECCLWLRRGGTLQIAGAVWNAAVLCPRATRSMRVSAPSPRPLHALARRR